MGRGLGVRQRELLAAVHAAAPAPLAVTGTAASHCESSALRRAARGLVRRGLVRAVFVRAPNTRGAYAGRLALVLPSVAGAGDFLPRNAPAWVTPPPLTMEGLTATVQAVLLERSTGQPCSRSRANRVARWFRKETEKAA